MGKIIVSEIVSLDGVMQDPEWSAPYINQEQTDFKMAEMLNANGLLLGRITYQEFASDWPSITDAAAGLPAGFSEQMNTLPKFVASTTLTEPLTWNATLLKGNVIEAIGALKANTGKDLLVYGSSELTHTLMQHNLVDEYRLLVYPVVVGKGKRLFKDGIDATLKLVEARKFKTGIVLLIYEASQSDTPGTQ